MKKLAIALLMITGSGLAQADYKLVNADGSELSQLCIAVATTQDSITKTAAKAGFSLAEIDSVKCNDLPLKRFATKYGKATAVSPTPTAYVLKASDTSEATALCLAAATSEVEFNKVKSMYFGTAYNIEEEVRCNGIPLKQFARKFSRMPMSITQR